MTIGTTSSLTLVAILLFPALTLAQSDSEQCKRLLDAISTIERTCLSGSSSEYSATLNGAVNLLRRSVDAKAAASTEEIRGARRSLEGQLQKPENDAIRECMRGYQERLLNCLEGGTKSSPENQSSKRPNYVIGKHMRNGQYTLLSLVNRGADAENVRTDSCGWIQVSYYFDPCPDGYLCPSPAERYRYGLVDWATLDPQAFRVIFGGGFWDRLESWRQASAEEVADEGLMPSLRVGGLIGFEYDDPGTGSSQKRAFEWASYKDAHDRVEIDMQKIPTTGIEEIAGKCQELKELPEWIKIKLAAAEKPSGPMFFAPWKAGGNQPLKVARP